MDYIEYKSCELCERRCRADRTVSHGACNCSDRVKLSRASLHMWEEPIISGSRGSGTIFFSGCSLSCVFCQNREISRGNSGIEVSDDRLTDIMLELEEQGAHNINLVTPTHFIPSIRYSISLARSRGLSVPIVYNTSSYESVDALRSLDGLVDIYLPDFKYYREQTARKYSSVRDYPTVAMAAIDEMIRQRGEPIISDGLMKSGVAVRILLLPGHVAEAKLTVKYLFDKYADKIFISLMNQYTPIGDMPSPLSRRVTKAEYEELIDYAYKLGVRNCFIQEDGASEESFIPSFDYRGVLQKNDI